LCLSSSWARKLFVNKEVDLVHWIIPANPKFYDVFGAFSETKTYWPITVNMSIGDTVYIYLTAPYKQIGFVCEVLEINIDQESITDSIRPFFKKDISDTGKSKLFMKIKTISTISIEKDSLLGLDHLKQNGLTGMLMGARKLENNPNLLSYIKWSLQ
jgi:hypothetical protein